MFFLSLALSFSVVHAHTRQQKTYQPNLNSYSSLFNVELGHGASNRVKKWSCILSSCYIRWYSFFFFKWTSQQCWHRALKSCCQNPFYKQLNQLCSNYHKKLEQWPDLGIDNSILNNLIGWILIALNTCIHIWQIKQHIITTQQAFLHWHKI